MFYLSFLSSPALNHHAIAVPPARAPSPSPRRTPSFHTLPLSRASPPPITQGFRTGHEAVEKRGHMALHHLKTLLRVIITLAVAFLVGERFKTKLVYPESLALWNI
jgi:hypothetical protein